MQLLNRSNLSFATTLTPLFSTLFFFTSCTVKTASNQAQSHVMEVSIPQQKLALFRNGKLVKTYPVSTSKFGIGDTKGSYKTPLGRFEVAEKIGDGKPLGAVFKSRIWTGEVIKPDAPGRDPIVSRILWLNGLESGNKNAYSRCIYIHGTAAERDVGKKASYGCVRMKSRDILDVFETIGTGARVHIVDRRLIADSGDSEEATSHLVEEGELNGTGIETEPIFIPEVETASAFVLEELYRAPQLRQINSLEIYHR